MLWIALHHGHRKQKVLSQVGHGFSEQVTEAWPVLTRDQLLSQNNNDRCRVSE